MQKTEKQKHSELIKTRFEKWLAYKGYTNEKGEIENVRRYEKAIKATEHAIRNPLKNGLFPGFETMYAIVKAEPELNVTWLYTGEGPMLLKDLLDEYAIKVASEPEIEYEVKDWKVEAHKWKDKYIDCLENKATDK